MMEIAKVTGEYTVVSETLGNHGGIFKCLDDDSTLRARVQYLGEINHVKIYRAEKCDNGPYIREMFISRPVCGIKIVVRHKDTAVCLIDEDAIYRDEYGNYHHMVNGHNTDETNAVLLAKGLINPDVQPKNKDRLVRI